MKDKPKTSDLYTDPIVNALKKLGWPDTPARRRQLMQLRAQDRARRDQMSFGEAFAKARKSHGGDGGTFMWQGRTYSTDVAKPKLKRPPQQIETLGSLDSNAMIGPLNNISPERQAIQFNKQEGVDFYSPTFMQKDTDDVLSKIRQNKELLGKKLEDVRRRQRMQELMDKINNNTMEIQSRMNGVKPEFAMGGAIGTASGVADMFIQPDEYGVKTDGGAILGGALKGAGMGATFGPIGAGVGALVGGVGSLIQNNKMERERDAARDAYQKSLAKRHMQQQQLSIAASPVQGIRGNQMYKKGGKVKYMDGGLTEFVGPSHEQGGIAHPAGIEVEGGETQMQNVIYSDELKPSKEFMDAHKYLGLKKGDTFADVSKKLTDMKEVYDDSPSGVQMKYKIDQAFQALTSEQIDRGVQPNEQEFDNGGLVPLKPRRPEDSMSDRAPAYNVVPVDYTPKYNSKFGFYADKVFDNIDKGIGELSSNPYALNALNYFGNLNTINNLETQRQPIQEQVVPLNYRDNRTAQFNRNAVQAREIGNQMNFADPQVQRANRAQLAAQLFSANNEVDAREDQMFNDQVARNQLLNAQINARNTGRVNQAQDEAMANRNYLQRQRLNARNTLMQGIQGNRQMDALRDLDIQKLAILANANPSGVGTRAIEDFMDMVPALKKLKKRNGKTN